MAHWLNLGEMLKLNARKYPETICLMDRERRFTFPETNRRVNRLCHAFRALGLRQGETISVLLENCIEFVEIYLAAAKTGLIVNPLNFRLIGSDIEYIANHADARAFITHAEFCPIVDALRQSLPAIPSDRYICVGTPPRGFRAYDDLLADQSEAEPEVRVLPEDTWVLMYTSGTTGRPKGVRRSHESYTAFYLINAVDFGFKPGMCVLNVMPLCHVNTTFFTFALTYVGGSAYIHPARSFRAEEILQVIEASRANFISLIPTHYALLLSLPEEIRRRYDVSSVQKLLCSSAPARMEHKRAIMEWFRGVELYEGYGSTEAGIVTTLMPHEQLTKVCSIGKESLGTDFVRILDEERRPVTAGQVGELYSRGPMLFQGYHKDPDKTAAAHAGEWFSAGDMAYEDADGYYFLVDRKHNMIITGGEHVYPSEVEQVLCAHPAVFDAAVIGLPDPKWGESVLAIVSLKDGRAASEEELLAHCRERLSGWKRPKQVRFIAAEEMPRTATGKILHRLLRARFAPGAEGVCKP